jgi:hypothetical protein
MPRKQQPIRIDITQTTRVYQLKVSLRAISPLIWRRLLVSSTTTISHLHAILQVAMGWEDVHLHRFRLLRYQAQTPALGCPASARDAGQPAGNLLLRWGSNRAYAAEVSASRSGAFAGLVSHHHEDHGVAAVCPGDRATEGVSERAADGPDEERMERRLESIKHYIWHGNSAKALDRLQDLEDTLACWGCDEAGNMPASGVLDSVTRMRKYVQELTTYITNNASCIVNYGERYRNGERISNAFVESTIRWSVSSWSSSSKCSGRQKAHTCCSKSACR